MKNNTGSVGYTAGYDFFSIPVRESCAAAGHLDGWTSVPGYGITCICEYIVFYVVPVCSYARNLNKSPPSPMPHVVVTRLKVMAHDSIFARSASALPARGGRLFNALGTERICSIIFLDSFVIKGQGSRRSTCSYIHPAVQQYV